MISLAHYMRALGSDVPTCTVVGPGAKTYSEKVPR